MTFPVPLQPGLAEGVALLFCGSAVYLVWPDVTPPASDARTLTDPVEPCFRKHAIDHAHRHLVDDRCGRDDRA
jgi:hypothetical protein